jgi:hypothetical protein
MYVFPAPVGALTTTSVPARNKFTAWCCQGSGSLSWLMFASMVIHTAVGGYEQLHLFATKVSATPCLNPLRSAVSLDSHGLPPG